MTDAVRALWIGGAPGAGKTTVATRLMRRYGLRLYSADTRTWQHRDRAIAAGNEAALRWESLSIGQRSTQPERELISMSLHHERGAMVTEDVRALPASPLVVGEGSVITPKSVPQGQPAVWLVLADELQDSRLVERDGRSNRLYRLLVDEINAEIEAAGAPTIAVGPTDKTFAAVVRFFGDALAAGPRAASLSEREALIREANLDVVEQVRGYYRRRWATGDSETVERTFICECGEPDCDAEVRSTVGRAARAPVLRRDHERGTNTANS